MKISKIVLLIFCISSWEIYTQTFREYETNPDKLRTNQWIFGFDNFIKFYPNNQADTFKISSIESSSVFSTSTGRIVVYTDGQTVWDSLNRVVTSGLLGNTSSSLGAVFHYNKTDSTLILFVTNSAQSGSKEFSYSKFQLSNSGINIVAKNKVLQTQVCEPLALIYSKDNLNAWIVCHGFNNNSFYAYRITDGVVIECPVISNTGSFNGGNQSFSAQIDMKFSNDGSYLLKSNLNMPITNGVQIFRFNNENGAIKSIFSLPKLAFPIMGLAFSPNSKNIYIIERDSALKIYRFYPEDSIYTVSSVKHKNKIYNQAFEIQSAPDNKLYFGIYDSSFLAYLTKPDDYSTFSVTIKGRGLLRPLNNNGLPNFNQSYFYTPSIDFAYKYDCIANSITFEGRDTFYANTHSWAISKSNKPVEASYSSKNIFHLFKDTGEYQVSYIAIKGGRRDTIIKKITIYPKIRKDFLGRDTAYEKSTSFSKTFSAPSGMHCYFWYNNSSTFSSFTTDTFGTFVCKVTTKSFCTVTDTVKISSCINNLSIPTIIRSRDTIYVSSGDADSFVWHRNGLQYKSGKERFLSISDTGYYTVEAIKPGHCNRISQTYHVQKLGVKEYLIQNEISVFPNPSDNVVSLEFKNPDNYEISVYNSDGKEVYTTTSDHDIYINLEGLSHGVYLLRITNTKNQQFYTKIIKE